MINYFEWPKKKLATTLIRLDQQNPRLTDSGKKVTQPEIIDYLINKEKVLDLVKSIISSGYFLNEQPIVYKEGDKYVVLEGNRRVAACKIIINPDLIKNTATRQAVKKSLKDFDLNIITKLEVYVSPSREAADIMIVNRHTGGSVVEKWDKTKQDRFIHNRFIGGESITEMSDKFGMTKSEIKKALQRYNTFDEINNLDLDSDFKKILQEETKFSMTNVERVYDSKVGRNFLGLEFDDAGGVIKKLPSDEFKKRLKWIVEKVISGEINSRTLNTDDQKQEYFSNLLSSGNFDTEIIPDLKYNDEKPIDNPSDLEEDPEQDDFQPKKTTNNTLKLIPNNIHFETGIKRIDEIFGELKSLKLKSHSNAIAVLFRSYIDMITYQFLKSNDGIKELLRIEGMKVQSENDKKIDGLKKILIEKHEIAEDDIDLKEITKILKLNGGVKRDFIPSLRFMLQHLATSELLEEVKLKQTLESYINKSSKVDKIIGHNEFNLLVHNEYYTNDVEELKVAWNKLEPLIEYFVNSIKSKK